MGRLTKFWFLSRREKALLCEAGSLYLVAKVSVHTIPFRHIERFLRTSVGSGAAKASDRQEDTRLVRLSLLRCGSLFRWKAPCLSRSIAEFIMLRRRGIPAVLYIGAKLIESSTLSAHAWVETNAAGANVDCGSYARLL